MGTPGTGTAGTPTAGTGTASGPAALSVLGWTSFLMPLIVSVAANFTWGLGTGSIVLIVAGLVSPLLLVLAVERWRALPGLTGWARVVQIAGMAVVAVVAAGWSWVHTTELLLVAVRSAERVPPTAPLSALPWLVVALCVAAPLAVDGLAVLSVQTLAITDLPASTGTKPTTSTGTKPTASTGTEPWGGPNAVPKRPAVPERGSTARDRVTSLPGHRTKRELEAAARALGVPRKAKETVSGLRARVEAAERARAQSGPVPA